MIKFPVKISKFGTVSLYVSFLILQFVNIAIYPLTAQRDCKKFDPVKRAKEIFTALDLNGEYSVLLSLYDFEWNL